MTVTSPNLFLVPSDFVFHLMNPFFFLLLVFVGFPGSTVWQVVDQIKLAGSHVTLQISDVLAGNILYLKLSQTLDLFEFWGHKLKLITQSTHFLVQITKRKCFPKFVGFIGPKKTPALWCSSILVKDSVTSSWAFCACSSSLGETKKHEKATPLLREPKTKTHKTNAQIYTTWYSNQSVSWYNMAWSCGATMCRKYNNISLCSNCRNGLFPATPYYTSRACPSVKIKPMQKRINDIPIQNKQKCQDLFPSYLLVV